MSSLEKRRFVSISLPEFVVRALEYRVSQTNEVDIPGEDVELNDIIEWYLVRAISVKDVAILDQQLPGFAAAVSRWLSETEFEF